MRLFAALVPLLLIAGGSDAQPLPPLTPVEASALVDGGEPQLESMIGQMILIGFPGTQPEEEWPQLAASMITASKIGGVILFAHNVVDPTQVKALNGFLHAAGSTLAPFICIDQEGGRIQRLTKDKGFVELPGATVISAMNDEDAFAHYLATANELADLGFNVNFGPVVDLNLNPSNPAIAGLGRSYASDPETVTRYARQFAKAHRQAGILTTAKHFPGHGSAPVDPHQDITDITNVWKPEELQPFRDLIAAGEIDLVMVGHLIHPRFSDEGTAPASLSALAIDKVLRGELGFRGLVVTDDLEMGAVGKRYGTEEAAVMAVTAGADLLIVANQRNPDMQIVDRTIAAIATAVADGRLPRERIADAYRLIVSTKQSIAGRRQHASEN